MSWLMAKDWATGVEYSSLFHSGLRVISLRPRARRARTCSSRSSSRDTRSSGDISSSSMASLSSRLVRRRTTRTRRPSPSISSSTESSPAPPSRAPNVAHPRPSSMYVPTKEMVDAWLSEASFDMGDFSKFPDEEHLCAGYPLSPIELDAGRSRSFVVDLGEVDGAMEEESFLLLNSPDGFLHHSSERPETMSVPSRCAVETGRERGDCAWMLEEPSPELEAYDPGNEEDEEEIRPENERDWRQFHVDWVLSIR
ncbi:hypothetical protein OG21DRAFT_1495479 [Imleria badia]|nr:hypothetical protein OG21DRAFT_1495479 [Imleria badia]